MFTSKIKTAAIAAMTLALCAAFAAPNPASDFVYDIDSKGKGVVIQGYKGAGAIVEIPAAIEGFPVTEIGEKAFKDCGALTSIKIPASVKKIGEDAFKDCKSLAAVEFGSEETAVYSDAFENCDSLSLKARAAIQKHPKAYW